MIKQLDSTTPSVIVCSKGTGEFVTVRDAIEKAKPGMRIVIRPGEYADRLVIDKPLEIMGMGDARQIILTSLDRPVITAKKTRIHLRGVTIVHTASKQTPRPELHHAIELYESSLLIENCSVSSDDQGCLNTCNDGCKVEAEGVQFNSGLLHNIHISGDSDAILRDCKFTQSGGSGIHASDGAEISIHQCAIERPRKHGIHIVGVAQSDIRHSQISFASMDGIRIETQQEITLDTVAIQGCGNSGIHLHKVVQSKAYDIHIFGNQGHGLLVESSQLEIENAQIHDNAAPGIDLTSQSSIKAGNLDLRQNKEANIKVNDGSEAFLRESRLEAARGHGALFDKDARGTLTKCRMAGNQFSGVNLKNGSQFQFYQCEILDNQRQGFDLAGQNTRATLDECNVLNNSQAGIEAIDGAAFQAVRTQIQGGKKQGVFIHKGAVATFEKCQIFANELCGLEVAEKGEATAIECSLSSGKVGALATNHSKLNMQNCYILHNSYPGIIVGTASTAKVEHCRINDCKQHAIYCYEDVQSVFSHCELTGNASGQVVFDRSMNATMSDCKISNGASKGLLVRNRAVISLVNCTFRNHQESHLEIRSHSKLHAMNCLFENSSDHGVRVSSKSDLRLEFCKIMGNAKNGLLTRQKANVELVSCSISRNAGFGIRACETSVIKGKGTEISGNTRGESEKCSDVSLTLEV